MVSKGAKKGCKTIEKGPAHIKIEKGGSCYYPPAMEDLPLCQHSLRMSMVAIIRGNKKYCSTPSHRTLSLFLL